MVPYTNDAPHFLLPWCKIRNLSHFLHLVDHHFMQSFRKCYWTVSEIFKDRPTDRPINRQGQLRLILSGKPGFQSRIKNGGLDTNTTNNQDSIRIGFFANCYGYYARIWQKHIKTQISPWWFSFYLVNKICKETVTLASWWGPNVMKQDLQTKDQQIDQLRWLLLS